MRSNLPRTSIERIPEFHSGYIKQGGVHQRRTRFIKEYLLDQNATRAAKAAGYSEKTAYSYGQQLLKKLEVKEAIQAANSKVFAHLEVSAEHIRAELARLAFHDPRKLLNPDGSAKLITDLDDDTAAAIAGFETAELFTGSGEDRALAGYVKKFKLADKGLNLERLGRILKMFVDRVEISDPDKLVGKLTAARQRSRERNRNIA
jgi:phage terminase small subunit